MLKAGNLWADLPAGAGREVFETLAEGGGTTIERIVSTGQATPAGTWYDQAWDEWVVLLSGSAGVHFADEEADRHLASGDWLHIPAHRRHRVSWTSADEPTVWLAVHLPSGTAQGEGGS